MNLRHLPATVALAAFAFAVPAQDKPAPDKPAADKKEAPEKAEKHSKDKVDFQKQIWPILEKRCVECHSAPHAGPDGKMKKPKGGVMFDSKAGITGSKSGKVVIAKKSADSMLFHSISLPADDEDRMPPAKKGDPLPKDQIELIQAWIDQGADFGSWTGKAKEAEKEKGDKPAGKPGEQPKEKGKEKGKEKEDSQARLENGLKPLTEAALATFANGPFAVASIGNGSPLLEVSCAGRTDDVDDKALASLAPIAEHVTSLYLGHTRVTDEGCATLAKMPRLTTLDLRQTMVSNHGTAALAACKELRSLNLFGTKAGDYGVAALAGLKGLEHLYVWQTDVSPAAVMRLRESLPDVQVVVAADLPEPMTEVPGAGRRRAAK